MRGFKWTVIVAVFRVCLALVSFSAQHGIAAGGNPVRDSVERLSECIERFRPEINLTIEIAFPSSPSFEPADSCFGALSNCRLTPFVLMPVAPIDCRSSPSRTK
jgi:hypothetical protein